MTVETMNDIQLGAEPPTTRSTKRGELVALVNMAMANRGTWVSSVNRTPTSNVQAQVHRYAARALGVEVKALDGFVYVRIPPSC